MNIGIDIGGTKTSVGLVDKNGEIILERTFPTRAQQPEVLVEEVVDQTKLLCQDAGMP